MRRGVVECAIKLQPTAANIVGDAGRQQHGAGVGRIDGQFAAAGDRIDVGVRLRR